MSDNTVPPVDPALDKDDDGVVPQSDVVGSDTDPKDVDHTMPGSPMAEPDHAPPDVDAPDMGMDKSRNEANPTHDPVLRDDQEAARQRVDATHSEGDPTLAGDSVQTPAPTEPVVGTNPPAPDHFRAMYTRNANGTIDASYWLPGSNKGVGLGNFGDRILAERAVQDAVANEFHRDRTVQQETRVREEAQALLDVQQQRREEALSQHVEEIDVAPASF